MEPAALTKNSPRETMKTVFISWRMGECRDEVMSLKPALEEAGVKVIVIGELPGEDLLQAVVRGMKAADLFIVMGTKTYGKQTNGMFDTRKEMQEMQGDARMRVTYAHTQNPPRRSHTRPRSLRRPRTRSPPPPCAPAAHARFTHSSVNRVHSEEVRAQCADSALK